jgi:transmembrane sensor
MRRERRTIEGLSMESHSQIEDEVAAWLARRDSGQWSSDDEARLEQWISSSTARRIAYLRLKSTWDAAARLRTLSAGAATPASGSGVPAPSEWRRSPFFEKSAAQVATLSGEQSKLILDQRAAPPEAHTHHSGAVPAASTHRARFLAIAASLLLVVTAGFGAYQLWGDDSDRYRTPVGGLASVPMADGSKVTLNTDSEIRVAVTQKERRIDLRQGEAFFDVAKDPTRPFVVRAGNKRIIAVGTKFSVQYLGEDVRVLVTEGKVRVEDAGSTLVLIPAGSIARTAGSGVLVQKAPPRQVEEFLSWREGSLRFHETSLAEAVAEINRYNSRKIFIEDRELAEIRISGTFRPTEYEAFVRVLRDGFAIQAHNDEEGITLTEAP